MDSSHTADILRNAGLSNKEAAVYLACLELGSGTIQEIADKAGVKRTSIYNFLEEMKGKGLVSEIKQGTVTTLVAKDPHSIVERMKKQTKQIESALPDLMSIFNQPGNKPRVRYFEGVEGLKDIYKDTLKTGEPVYAFSDYEKMFGALDEEYMWEYAKKRADAGIRFYGIAKSGLWQKKVDERNSEQAREQRVVGDLPFDTEVNIYGNKVAFLSFRRPYAGVIIEDRAIAQTMKTIWKLVWESTSKPS